MELEAEIPSDWIIAGYQRALLMDVSRFFRDTPTVRLYRCGDSGYRFFYPDALAGDGAFYGSLETTFPWYYEEWRHEHAVAGDIIPATADVLEIGCGTGGFLARMEAKGCSVLGLELNETAVAEAQRLGRPVLQESMDAHAATGKRYDFVCAFQTLEHVPKPVEFVRQAAALLRRGGQLLVTVPNNGGYLRWTPEDWLNLPPHHMGRYDAESLRRAAQWFGLEVVSVVPQRLQPEHVRGWVGTIEALAAAQSRVLARLVFRAGRPLLEAAVGKLAPSIDGHTVMAVYQAPR